MLHVHYQQLKMLETAQSASPDCNWWLKGDGCDLVEGLGESTRLIWSGDVDLNDGKREELYKTYRSLLDFIGSLTINDDAIVNLNKCSAILLQEKEFLVKGMYYILILAKKPVIAIVISVQLLKMLTKYTLRNSMWGNVSLMLYLLQGGLSKNSIT